MTKEEAIEVLNGILKLNYREWWDYKCDEAVEIAIESLQKDIERHKMVIRASERHLGIVRCKDCRWWQDDYMGTWCSRLSGVRSTNADDFCSWGERRSSKGEEVNGFKSVGQAWNTSQGRWEP